MQTLSQLYTNISRRETRPQKTINKINKIHNSQIGIQYAIMKDRSKKSFMPIRNYGTNNLSGGLKNDDRNICQKMV